MTAHETIHTAENVLSFKGRMNRRAMKHEHNTICERLRELIPAYSLGATDAEETEFVKVHLADCPEAAAELAEYTRLAVALLHLSLIHI